MTKSAFSRSILDNADRIHLSSCASWGETVSYDEPADLEATDLSAEVISYGLEARRVYSDLRRLVGQVAGLLVLVQASQRREALDLPILAGAKELWVEIPNRLKALRAPGALNVNFYHLKSSYELIGTCISALSNIANVDGTPDLSIALGNLATAYRHLQSASSDRLGMTMVDFRQSCCNCGQQ
jgi:hypothetical protein